MFYIPVFGMMWTVLKTKKDLERFRASDQDSGAESDLLTDWNANLMKVEFLKMLLDTKHNSDWCRWSSLTCDWSVSVAMQVEKTPEAEPELEKEETKAE